VNLDHFDQFDRPPPAPTGRTPGSALHQDQRLPLRPWPVAPRSV